MGVAPSIELSGETRPAVVKLPWRHTAALRVTQRNRIVPLASEGMANKEIAQRLAVAPRMAALWRGRFLEPGTEGLMKDAPRPGLTQAISAEMVAEVVARTKQSKPTGARHWW